MRLPAHEIPAAVPLVRRSVAPAVPFPSSAHPLTLPSTGGDCLGDVAGPPGEHRTADTCADASVPIRNLETV
jgi:hypothetical protein